ncbi:hypothetical protein [Brevundimonas sp.]|uniref:hypothetical protein n=1 Tax=Brevundimonas sp. TaxID=1871086 RepID=UPI002FC99907
MKLAAILLLVAGQTGPEQPVADCRVPQVPAVARFTKPVRPNVPACIDEARNRHNCRAAVITTYNGQMEKYGRDFDRYVTEMNDYVGALNRYVDEASRYSVCERDAAGIVSGVITG